MVEVTGPVETDDVPFPVNYKIDQSKLDSTVSYMRQENIRPGGLFVVTREGKNGQTEFLVAKSATAKDEHGRPIDVWSMPQGGIKEGESLPKNIVREMQEEHFLNANDILSVDIGIVEPQSLMYSEERKAKEAKKGRNQQGKGYIPSQVRLKPGTVVSRKPDEVLELKWLPKDEAISIINDSQAENDKKTLSETAIRSVD